MPRSSRRADRVAAWAGDHKGYAFSLLPHGGNARGLQAGGGALDPARYAREAAAADAVQSAGFDPYGTRYWAYAKTPCGKDAFHEILGSCMLAKATAR
jgi:hypothetical protein